MEPLALDESSAVDARQNEEGELDVEGPAAQRKPCKLSAYIITRRNLPPQAPNWSQDAIAAAVGELTHVHLDRENIDKIDGLELLGSRLSCLYLQHNNIRQIENLDCLRSLRFLALQYNCIRRVENLGHLSVLGFLDLSHNVISECDIEELPKSVVILDLRGNECTAQEDLWSNLTAALPKLRQLNGADVTGSLSDGSSGSDDSDADGADVSAEGLSDPQVDAITMKGVFHTQGAAIVARSRSRMEELKREHDLHSRELEAIRSRLGIYVDGERPDSGRDEGRSPLSGSQSAA